MLSNKHVENEEEEERFCVLKTQIVAKVGNKRKSVENEPLRVFGIATTRRRVLLVGIINVLSTVCFVFIALSVIWNARESNWIWKLTHKVKKKPRARPQTLLPWKLTKKWERNHATRKSGVKSLTRRNKVAKMKLATRMIEKETIKQGDGDEEVGERGENEFAAPSNDAIVKTQTEFIILLAPRSGYIKLAK